MEKWEKHIERGFPVTAQRMGNGTWVAVWRNNSSHDDVYGHRHPDACFSADELESSPDWHGLVRTRLGLDETL